MEDLSHLYVEDPITALVPNSMAGGNMMSSNKLAMTAPGSQPVDPLPPAKEQADPKVTPSNSTQIQPGDDGKPDSRAWSPPGPPDWLHHADGETGAGTYDEPSFGRAPHGLGRWRQA